MSEKSFAADVPTLPTSRRFRFRLRHVFYLLTAACLFLGVPMLRYTFGMLTTACVVAALILGPLIVAQSVFILIIPRLRRRLFAKSPPAILSPPRECSKGEGQE